MSKFRINKNDNFTILNNTIFKDRCLSFKAKGILCLMMSLPEDWNYTLKGLAALSKDNIDSVRQGVNELKKAGYIVQHQVKDENGRWAESVYDVYEEPQQTQENVGAEEKNLQKNTDIKQDLTEYRSSQNGNDLTDLPSLDFPITVNQSTQNGSNLTDLPSLDFPITEKPITENPTQLNTKELNNKYINNTISYQSIYHLDNNIPLTSKEKPMDKMDMTLEKRQAYKELVHENIDYEYMSETMNRIEIEQVDGIVELMLDVICSEAKIMRVGGNDISTELVRSRFLKLTSEHIDYVLQSLRSNTTKVRNIRAYVITSLYNAYVTMDAYYTAEVAHDMNGYPGA